MMTTPEVQEGAWQEPHIPPPRPDPIQPGPRLGWQAEKVNLRDYVEMRLANVDEKNIMRVESLSKELTVAMRASEIAIDKAERATEKRFESVNEFRQTLSDQTATFVARTTFDAMHRNLIEKIDAMSRAQTEQIQNVRASLDAKADAQWKVIFTLAGAVAAIQATLAFLT